MKKSFAILALAICFVLASCTNEVDASLGGDQKELFVPFQVLSSALFYFSIATFNGSDYYIQLNSDDYNSNTAFRAYDSGRTGAAARSQFSAEWNYRNLCLFFDLNTEPSLYQPKSAVASYQKLARNSQLDVIVDGLLKSRKNAGGGGANVKEAQTADGALFRTSCATQMREFDSNGNYVCVDAGVPVDFAIGYDDFYSGSVIYQNLYKKLNGKYSDRF